MNLQQLIQLTKDVSPDTRRRAVWSLGKIGGKEVISLLIEIMNEDSDKNVRLEAIYSLSWINTAECLDALYQIVMNNNEDQDIREVIGDLLINEHYYCEAYNKTIFNLLKRQDQKESSNTVCCPVCACENCHIEKVAAYPVKGETEYIIDKSGSTSNSHFPEPGMRGAVVKMQMYCEYGHIFDLKFQFHKGETTLALEPSGEFDVMTEKRSDDLWRS